MNVVQVGVSEGPEILSGFLTRQLSMSRLLLPQRQVSQFAIYTFNTASKRNSFLELSIQGNNV